MCRRSIAGQTETKLQINWKSFYRQVCLLVIPMALQNLINVGVTAADVMMLGRVGEKVLSGSSLAGQVQFIMTLILFGTTSGATVLTAQYWGKKDTRTIEKVMGIGMRIGVLCAAIFTLAAELAPGALLHIFTDDPEVIAEGVKYLRIVALSYVFMAFTQVYLNIMRSIERVVISTVVYSLSLLINVLLNGLLIFGMFGLPRLGIVGAAIATLTARLAELGIVIWYARCRNRVVCFHFRDIWHMDRLLFRDFLTYSVPVIVNELMWGLGTSANTAVIGHLGSAAIAAGAVAQMARQLATVVAFGVSSATAVYLGRVIGEKRYEHAKAYGRRFAGISILTGLAGAAVILLAYPLVRRFMVLSPKAQGYLGLMFVVMSYFTVCQSLNTTLIVGVFRSGGDTRFGLALDMSTMWGCSILLGAAAAFIFHAGVPVVYILLMSDEVIKVPFSLRRFLSYKWIRDVTRDADELSGA